MAYYRIPAGGLRVDGAVEGDLLVAVTDDVTGDVVFRPAALPTPVTVDDGAGGFALVFAEDGTVVYT